jgi:hypothetical protein
MSPGRPPNIGFEHTIEMEEGAKNMITTHYSHPSRFKDDIEREIKELTMINFVEDALS